MLLIFKLVLTWSILNYISVLANEQDVSAIVNENPSEHTNEETLLHSNEEAGSISLSETIEPLADPNAQETFAIPNVIQTDHIQEYVSDVTVGASLDDATLQLKISSSRCYTAQISATYEDVFHRVETFYNKNHNLCGGDETSLDGKEISFRIPSSLAYFDDQSLDKPTNFYVKDVEVYLSFYSMSGNFDSDKHIPLQLVSPWFRKPRPRYCRNWLLDLRDRMKWSYVPTCAQLYDTTIFSSILAFSGKDVGFTRKIAPMAWPSHAPKHIKEVHESDTKMTVTFWIYLTRYCPSGLCMIFQHRVNDTYLTPLILLNEAGLFHIQLHNKLGGASAFLSGSPQPLKLWTYVILAIEGVRAELTVSHGYPHTKQHQYIHIGENPYHCNATVGVLSIGGYGGSLGFTGFSGPVHFYQNKMMSVTEATFGTTKIREKLTNKMKMSSYIDECSYIKPRICKFVLGMGAVRNGCTVEYWNKTSPKEHGENEKVHSHVDGRVLSGYLLGKLQSALIKRSPKKGAILTLEEYSKVLYERTMKNLERQALASSTLSRLFEISGCLGDMRGYYAAAVMNKYGFGMKADVEKTHHLHLMGALYDYPLALLGLAHRHQLGMDGSPHDLSIVAGYLRRVAIHTKEIIEREEQTVVTGTEMVRLDQAHLFRDVRGADSQLMKWLEHQANMGSGEAQNRMADIMYHGREGAQVNRDQALQFYQMAAAQNDPSALFNLGVMHLKGINMEKNETKAFEFFKKAAEHNNSIAFNAIAFVELQVNNNRSGAIHYWKKAADLNDGDGLDNYAKMVEAGLNEGEPGNHTGAYYYFEKGALQGSKNAGIRVADYLIAGDYVNRDVKKATTFYRFVSDQLNHVGVCLKDALHNYLHGEWHMALFHYLLANDAGIALGGYNTALLLEEYQDQAFKFVGRSDPYYYYNTTAEQGWSLSLVAMGHKNWYNTSSRSNLKAASLYYARAIEVNNHPEGLFNLAFIVEHGYPLHKNIQFKGIKNFPTMNRNLTMALHLYQSCIDSVTDENEGYYPCQIAVARVKILMFLLRHTYLYYVLATLPIAVASIVTYIKLRT